MDTPNGTHRAGCTCPADARCHRRGARRHLATREAIRYLFARPTRRHRRTRRGRRSVGAGAGGAAAEGRFGLDYERVDVGDRGVGVVWRSGGAVRHRVVRSVAHGGRGSDRAVEALHRVEIAHAHLRRVAVVGHRSGAAASAATRRAAAASADRRQRVGAAGAASAAEFGRRTRREGTVIGCGGRHRARLAAAGAAVPADAAGVFASEEAAHARAEAARAARRRGGRCRAGARMAV